MNPVTFSTLACPSWSIETIASKASEFGYDGIEWRGGPQGHVQPDMPAARKAVLRQICADRGLMVLAVTAYTSFVSNIAEDRQANVDELRRYTDLAAELGASYVRAFLGELPAGTTPDTSMYENMVDCLNSASEYALSAGVNIAIEPHDNFVRSSAIAPLFNQTRSRPSLQVIWDIGNAYAAGEDPVEGFEFLKDRLAYVHVKDGKGRGDHWQLCSLGQGDVALNQAFGLLLANGYGGAFSVEWEYAWHPELDPPESALPSALQVINDLLAKVPSSHATN